MTRFVRLVRRFGTKAAASAAAFGLVWFTLSVYTKPGSIADLVTAFSLCG